MARPLRRSPASPVRLLVGSVTFLIFAANTIFWVALLYVATLLKIVVPLAAWRRLLSRVLTVIAEAWIAGNSLGLALTQPTRWDVAGLEGLRRDASYLVLSNHQSWVDIPVLQKVFLGKIPFLRFFLKKELIRVPLLGAAWWALDFPFMKRHSREELERHPEKRAEDLETTRKACEKFRHAPVSVINFVEGTRFTEEKRARSGSPFRHLLPPKAGGLAFAASALGTTLRSLVDVTIAYPDGRPTFWDLISRGLPRVVVRVRELPIPGEWLTGDYQGDEAFRARVQERMRLVWEEKDALVDRLVAEGPAA